MCSIFTSLVVGVVSGVIACYIYDKFLSTWQQSISLPLTIATPSG